MTTQVIVKSPSPNHQDVMVCVADPTTKEVREMHRLREGEEISLYIHSNAGLTISEVAKEPAEAPAA
jgi:hypothetical protein